MNSTMSSKGQISFSNDTTRWTRQVSTDNGALAVGTHHGKPGLVAVPGGLLSSQQIMQCPFGVEMNSDGTCGVCPKCTHRQPGDVIGHGMGLLISKDGVHWSLFKKLWPLGGMYTTLAALTTGSDGTAHTYGVVFSAGAGPADSGTGNVFYQNFTAVAADGTVDPELQAALDRL